MQPNTRMKQITVALAAAGFGLAVGAGYNRLDTPALSLANAAAPASDNETSSAGALRERDVA